MSWLTEMNRFTALCVSSALVFGCGGDAEDVVTPEGQSVQASGQPNSLGFSEWFADFPYPVHLSPDSGQGYYHLQAGEALERLVAKLQGNCTRDGWVMAMAFPERGPATMVPLLIESLDRAMQTKHLADLVQNTAEAMGRIGRYRTPELADALMRALAHPKVAIQNAAMAALIHSGTAETVRAARTYVPRLQLRGQADWVRAVGAQLPEDEVVEIYLELLHGDTLPRLFAIVVDEAAKLPQPVAARVLGSLWNDARGGLRLKVAGVLHRSGDLRGTRFLREILQNGEGESKAQAVLAAAGGDLEYLRDDVLRLSMDANSKVRHAVALTVGGLPGENIDNLLANLAVDPADDVRHTALTMLRGREQRDLLDRLVQRVRTASGSKLIQALGDLSAAGDDAAVDEILARMKASPKDEWRKFVQALGLSRTQAAFGALQELFLLPEEPIDIAAKRTNVMYTAVVMANLESAGGDVLKLFTSLPRDDYRRRGCLLYTLSDMAAVTKDQAFAERVYAAFRDIVHDRQDLPQMRLLALTYLRRDLDLDDMRAVQKLQQEEESPMKKAFTDFLYEFY